jgi:hypothetical protein
MTHIRSVVHLPSVSETMRILLRAGDADGSLGAVELTMGPGEAGPPLHLHRLHADESAALADLAAAERETELLGPPMTPSDRPD